jgi:hypothetical protein
VLQKLLEKLTGEELSVPEVTQSEEGQRNKLKYIFAFFSLLQCVGSGSISLRYGTDTDPDPDTSIIKQK